jgi:polyhydroxybutyrate depolymerase
MFGLATACGGSGTADRSPTEPSGRALGATTAAAASLATAPTSLAPNLASMAIEVQGRRAELIAPQQVTAPAPLLVVIHGFGSTPEEVNGFFGATDQAASRGLYVLLPTGSRDRWGNQFWDATAACCNFTGTPVDDVGYLERLIDETMAARPVDPTRVYVLGHSNGGFMAYRLACDLADKITAVAVFAGSDAPTAEECEPTRPVSVLHLHGRADSAVPYVGGEFTARFPGAEETVARWASRDRCGTELTDVGSFDLDTGVYGAETSARAYQDCPPGIGVQLDTIAGGEHSPRLDHDAVGTQVIDWLLGHSR